MSWLSDRQLYRKVMKNGDTRTKKAFFGVYPIDELPDTIPHLPIFIIVNTHAHNLGGEHWKTIYIDKNRRGEVFDSLAQPMSNLLIRWLNQFTRSWITNRKVYQHDANTTCGAFALFFVLTRLDCPSFNAFTQAFSRSLNENECVVRTFYRSLK